MMALLLLFYITTGFADAENTLRFGLSQSQFAGEPQAQQIQNDQNWSLGAISKKQEEGWGAGAEVIGFGSFQASLDQYVGVPELYFKTKNKSNVFKERQWAMTIGRERRLWSRMDDQLSLGVWQPALRWDAMRPVSQGLTGLFFDLPLSKKWSATVMTSPIFLPDQGPNFRLVDGRFESQNRWFRQPISQFQMMGNNSAISYELEKPGINEVIFQSSFASSLRFEENNFWAQASAAYMPANQLHLGLGKYQSLSLASSDRETLVKVFPKTYKHNIFSLETGLKNEKQEGWLSFMTDYPQRPEFSQKNEMGAGWEESELSRKYYIGAGYQHKLPGFWGVGHGLQVSVLRAWKEALPQTSNNLMDQPVPSSFDRPFYEKLVALDWMLAWKKYSRKRWEGKLRYWQTFDPRSAWVSPVFSWIDGPWTWSLSADLLGSQGNDEEALKSFFGQYRNNSRVLMGLSYVF